MGKPTKKQVAKKAGKIKEDAKREAEVMMLRKIIRENLYPLVAKESQSIEDALMFIQTMQIGLTQGFQAKAKTISVKDLELEKELSGDHTNRYRTLLEMISNLSIDNATEILDALVRKIQDALRGETKVKKLKDLTLSLD